ncbi:MAG TPA: hypothetical protein VG937_19835 [Polyangiaceae bacterium]|nr:hypothetical protein [Polyangiaceae bacterium]
MAFAAAWLVCSFASRAAAQGSGQGPVSAASNVSTANEERERVILLVRTANDEGVMNRVRAELGASAWRILELRLDERLAKVSLGKLSAQQQARAAVRFSAAEARVELWVSAPAGNIEETLDASDQRDDDAVVALRISEALRARGLNLGPETKAESESGAASEARREGGAKPSVARSKPAANDVRERANRRSDSAAAAGERSAAPGTRSELWLELAGALSGGPGGLGASLDAWGSVRLDFGSRWACSLLGVIPVAPPELDGAEGSARVARYQLGALAEATWLRTRGLRFGGGLGVSGSRTEMQGSGAAGYVGGTDSVFALGPLARAVARARITDGLWLSANGLAGLSFPEVSVKFADRVAGRWGRPLLMVTLGIELRTVRFSEGEGRAGRFAGPAEK